MREWSVVIVALVVGCGEERRPGPCSAHRETATFSGIDCTMTYDADGRLLHTDCANPDDAVAQTVSYTYEGGRWSSIVVDQSNVGGEGHYAATWTFAGDAVEMSSTAFFAGEPSTQEIADTLEPDVAFWGHPQDPEEVPSAPDSLLHRVVNDDLVTDFTYDGPSRQGVRTQTSSAGGTNVYGYDDAGRLVRHDSRTITYDGDLLTSWMGTTYAYDDAGNLTEKTTLDGQVTTYGYECW